MLVPLQQWICDTCGCIIEAPNHGFIEWKKTEDGQKYGFRIVHNAKYSPYKDSGGSCFYSSKERGGDLYLERVVGPDGLVTLTSWIDVGEWHEDDYRGPSVRDLREWVKVFRRVQLPYYEEARQYTDELRDASDTGLHEIAFYLHDQLKEIIDEHEKHGPSN